MATKGGLDQLRAPFILTAAVGCVVAFAYKFTAMLTAPPIDWLSWFLFGVTIVTFLWITLRYITLTGDHVIERSLFDWLANLFVVFAGIVAIECTTDPRKWFGALAVLCWFTAFKDVQQRMHQETDERKEHFGMRARNEFFLGLCLIIPFVLQSRLADISFAVFASVFITVEFVAKVVRLRHERITLWV